MKKCKKCNVDMYPVGLGKWLCDFCDNVIEEETKCENCGENRATEIWVGETGVFGYTHGLYNEWCKLCCAKERLKYAEKAAAQIPAIKKEIKELENEEQK